jgi:hypothetical protein
MWVLNTILSLFLLPYKTVVRIALHVSVASNQKLVVNCLQIRYFLKSNHKNYRYNNVFVLTFTVV